MGWWITKNKLSTEQREFISAIKKDLKQVHWVQGAAGTGKTTVLAALAQELRVDHPNDSIYYLTYTHALKDLALKAFQEENVEGVHFLTHTRFLSNNLPCDFVFLDEVQDIKPVDLQKIKLLAKHLIIAGDCTQSIYEHSSTENEIQQYLLPTQHLLILMHRLTEYLAAIASKILPSSNIIGSKPSNTSANTTIRLLHFPDQNKEFIWATDEALSRARPDKPCCILFSHHKEITVFINLITQHLGVGELGPKIGYDTRKKEQLDYYQLNENLKFNNINIRYLGNSFGDLKEIDQKPMVYIMTYHSAKGLDFDSVFIPQLNDNKQIVYNFVLKKNPDLDKRLLFVATTRSRCNLFLTYSSEYPHSLISDLPNVVKTEYQSKEINDDDDEDFF